MAIERYYVVDYQKVARYPDLWINHKIRQLDRNLNTGSWIPQRWNTHKDDASIKEFKLVSCIADDIETKNPDKVLIFSGSELDFTYIYGDLYNLLADWCVKNNKKIHIFVSALRSNLYVPDYVEIHAGVQTYDINNYNSIVLYYNPTAPKEVELQDVNLGQIVSSPAVLFTCYNNRPCNYRSYLIDQLARHRLLHNSVTTYKRGMEEIPPSAWVYYNGNPKLVDEERIFYSHILPRKYLTGAIDIVTETSISNLEFYMSEKTAKPLIALKPFLVLGAPGYHNWLREHKGIEWYDELFDYSFDNESDYKKRADGIIENIIRLNEIYKTPDSYKTLIESIKHKAKSNLIAYIDHIHSGKSLIDPLPEWLDRNTIKEIIFSKKHYGTLGYYEGELQSLAAFISNPYFGAWREEINENQFSLYQHILNL